ncbi:MAG: RNA methyltransferase [Thermodesulfobacteriota bacterium]
MADVYIALVHHPVYNKNREVIASALTTVDLHDLARVAATYGLAGFFVVTPLEDQLKLAREMVEHWTKGWGLDYNPNRGQALRLVRLARDLVEARAVVAAETGAEPLTAATSAADGEARMAFSQVAGLLKDERPLLIVFGTAWGLTEEVLAACDITIEAVRGPTEYNHLSVRSAAGIVLDRLLGRG